MALILVLCALLVVAAIIANALLKDFVWGEAGGTAAPENSAPAQLDGENGGPAVVVVPSAPVETQEPEPTEAPKASSYQVFKEDLSWTEAQARCQEMGGHLAVISDQAEFDKIVALLEDAGLSPGLARLEPGKRYPRLGHRGGSVLLRLGPGRALL